MIHWWYYSVGQCLCHDSLAGQSEGGKRLVRNLLAAGEPTGSAEGNCTASTRWVGFTSAVSCPPPSSYCASVWWCDENRIRSLCVFDILLFTVQDGSCSQVGYCKSRLHPSSLLLSPPHPNPCSPPPFCHGQSVRICIYRHWNETSSSFCPVWLIVCTDMHVGIEMRLHHPSVQFVNSYVYVSFKDVMLSWLGVKHQVALLT